MGHCAHINSTLRGVRFIHLKWTWAAINDVITNLLKYEIQVFHSRKTHAEAYKCKSITYFWGKIDIFLKFP